MRNSKRNLVIMGTLFEAGFLLLSTVVSIVLASTVIHDQSSAKWSEVNGKIYLGANNPLFAGDIWYEYRVGTKAYRSSRVSFSRPVELNRFKDGAVVKVFYDPTDQSTSVLVPGASTTTCVWLGLFVLALIASSYTLAIMLRKLCTGKAADQDVQHDSMIAILRFLFLP